MAQRGASREVVVRLPTSAMSASQWSGTPHGYASNVNPAQKAFECAVCLQAAQAGRHTLFGHTAT